MRTVKEKEYFRKLQREMLSHRSYFLYDPESWTVERTTWRRTKPMTDLEERRENTTHKKDMHQHIAASLQHDLWS